MPKLHSQLTRHKSILVLGIEKILSQDAAQTQKYLVRIIRGGYMQTGVLIFVSVEYVAVKFKEHFESHVSIVLYRQK